MEEKGKVINHYIYAYEGEPIWILFDSPEFFSKFSCNQKSTTAVKLQVVGGFLRPVEMRYLAEIDEINIAAEGKDILLEGWKKIQESDEKNKSWWHSSDSVHSPWLALGVMVNDGDGHGLNETDLLPWRGFPLDDEEAR